LIHYTIPWPPHSGNHQHGFNSKSKKIFKKPQQTKWANDVILLSKSPSFEIKKNTFIRLHCFYFPPDKRKRDMDNAMKPVRDVLSKILDVDDKNFFLVEYGPPVIDKENPRIEIDVEIFNIGIK